MTTEKPNEVKNIGEILNLMNRVNETFTYEIWVPSLNKEVMFREINTSQQKRLIKSIIDSPVFNTEFIFTMSQIIKENCAGDISIDELTILDKLFICLKMRSVSISDDFEFEFEKFGKTQKRGLSIINIYEEAKKTLNLEIFEPGSFTDDIYTIECAVPTMKTEYQLEKEFHNNANDIEFSTPTQIREIVGEMYITEIIKFIKCLTIKNEDEIIRIDFNDNVTFKNRISVIERLPVKLVDKVIKYISKIKSELEKVVLIKTFALDENNEKQEIEEVLAIDGNFFINS